MDQDSERLRAAGIVLPDGVLEALREYVKEQVMESQRDGLKLGARLSAKMLRQTADECSRESVAAPDYVRGLRDAAEFIERFTEGAVEASHG